MRNSKLLAVLFTGLSIVSAPSAFGDGPAPSTVSADRDATLVELDSEPGEIDISRLQPKIESGYVQGSDGSKGLTLRLRGGHPFYIGGERVARYDGEKVGGVLKLDLGGSVEADVNADSSAGVDKGLSRLDLQAPALSLFAMQSQTGGSTAEERKKGEDKNPHATGDVALVTGRYRKVKIDALDTDVNGAQVDFVPFSLHGAIKVNGVNLDLCGHMEPLGFFAGDNKLAGGEQPTMGRTSGGVCGGVQLGQIGNLRGSFDYAYSFVNHTDEETTNEGETVEIDIPDAHLAQVSTRVGLERIAGTPVGVAYEYSYESASAGTGGSQGDKFKDNSRHMVVVQGAW